MSQQINLYSPIFRRQKKYFSSSAMALSLGVVVVGMSVLCVYARMQVASLSKQADQTANNLVTQTAQLQALIADKSGEARQKELEGHIKAAESLLAARQQLAQALKSEMLSNSQGFSEPLLAFTRQRVEGVWLTRVSVDAESNDLTIIGQTRQPELVPTLIESIRKEKTMRGRSFEHLEITKMQAPASAAGKADSKSVGLAEQPDLFEFRLRTADVTQAENVGKSAEKDAASTGDSDLRDKLDILRAYLDKSLPSK